MNVKTIALVIPFLGFGIYSSPHLLNAEIVILQEDGKKTQIRKGENYGKNNGWKRETEEEKSTNNNRSKRAPKPTEEEEIVIEGEIFGELPITSPENTPLPPPLD